MTNRNQNVVIGWRRQLLLVATTLLLPGQLLFANDTPSPDGVANGSETTRREELLSSESWRKPMNGLDEWLSVQTINNRKQVDQIEKQLADRVQKMSADELEAFQQDFDAKLQMVLSPDGRDILGWVAANLAAAAPAYRKKLGLEEPDLLKLTAAQLREQLDLLQRKRSAAQSQTAALEQSRQARIAALQAEQRQQYDERERALARGASNFGPAGYRSHYHPNGMRKYPDVVSRPAYGFGFGYGFGFW